MAFDKPYDINPNPGGDTVKEAILYTDLNVEDIYNNLNLLLAQITLLPNDGQELLDLLKPVDGTGSELDADLLDGFHATEFSHTSHSHPLTTSSVPGFMAPIDKQKLDGIASGAEVNVQSDWGETSSSSDAFLRNKPQILDIEGTPQSGDVTVFTGPTSIHGSNPQEMQNLLDYYTSGDFIAQTAGVADAGKPIVLGVDGLIHPTMIPAVPAQAVWGAITGTLANQTDLQDELDLKLGTTAKAADSELLDGLEAVAFELALGNPANDGEILSSTAAGVRSWIPAPSGGGDAVWGSITGTLSAQTDLQDELDAKSDTGHNHDSSYFLESEFIPVSAGVGDAGKPIVLNSAGQVDASMIDVSVFYYVGSFTPVAGTEYPDTTGESHGAFWVVQGVDPGGYTFTGGDLSGLTINNGDFMVFAAAGWSIMAGEMNPILYYRLDGSQPLTDPFAGGGQQLKAIADGTDDTDAVTKAQLDTKLSLAGGTLSGFLHIAFAGKALEFTGESSNYISGVAADGSSGWYIGRTADNDDTLRINNYKGSKITLPIGGGALLDGAQIYTDDYHPGASAPAWGDITGTLSAQTDLQDALDLKSPTGHTHTEYLPVAAKAADSNLLDGKDSAAFELALGNPTADNQILVSLTDGTRGWATLPTTLWGGIEGTLANQTDLQAALDLKSPSGHTHSEYLPIAGKAADSSKLNGKADTAFALVAHDHAGVYLPVAAKAADSSLLNGEPRTQFVSTAEPDPAQGVDGDVWYQI